MHILRLWPTQTTATLPLAHGLVTTRVHEMCQKQSGRGHGKRARTRPAPAPYIPSTTTTNPATQTNGTVPNHDARAEQTWLTTHVRTCGTGQRGRRSRPCTGGPSTRKQSSYGTRSCPPRGKKSGRAAGRVRWEPLGPAQSPLQLQHQCCFPANTMQHKWLVGSREVRRLERMKYRCVSG